MRNVIVLGAGMAGVCTALHLQRRGWSVALVDRKAPGMETSFGNAGIIQAEAVEPYAMPRDLLALLSIATRRSNDVHYLFRDLPAYAGPLLRYWWNSRPGRHRAISNAYATIIAHATGEHAPLIEEAGAGNLVRRDGFRVMYRAPRDMDEAVAEARRVEALYGVAFRVMDPRELMRAEPALRMAGAGAIHWPDPWCVSDPGRLTAAYGALFTRGGGVFVHGDAESLARREGGGWRVDTRDGALDAEHVVVALGPWAPSLLLRFGYRVPMLRKRGYHRHYATQPTLDLPLMDAANGYVMAPMARGLRITTGAELAPQDARREPVQLKRAEMAANELLVLGAPEESTPWLGSRPCMPDMLPVVGAAPRTPGLWFNFGHGHQGFTLGPATGRLLAELMAKETAFVDPRPFAPDRLWTSRS